MNNNYDLDKHEAVVDSSNCKDPFYIQQIKNAHELGKQHLKYPDDANNNGNVEVAEREAFLDSSSTTGRIENETEDWQILDAEDRQLIVKNDKMSGDKKYIEISPLPSSSKFSPILIYLCTALYSIVPVASVLATFTLIGLLFSRFYFITLIYFAFIFWDRETCNRGGRRLESVYRAKFWSYLAAYFPIKFRHTANFKLDPNENYILNYCPHGISAFGAVTAFATNGLNFSELFPGLTARFMVHETSFMVPIMRETFALRGDCSVNSQSIDYMLSSKLRTGKAGNLLAIVVGGLAEADLSDSEVLKVVVAERKGFVKKALIHGANIIPCIAFGENSVFNKVNLKPTSLMYQLESKWYSLFKFKHPIYYGRSLIANDLKGSMPYNKPITVVMGNPITIKRVEKPSQQEIDEIHKEYMDQLLAMYEANNDLCSEFDRKLELM